MSLCTISNTNECQCMVNNSTLVRCHTPQVTVKALLVRVDNWVSDHLGKKKLSTILLGESGWCNDHQPLLPAPLHVHWVSVNLNLILRVLLGYSCFLGCSVGEVVRALASHQCGPGSIPRSGVRCGLSLLFLFSAPRGFLQVLRFPLSSKTTI